MNNYLTQNVSSADIETPCYTLLSSLAEENLGAEGATESPYYLRAFFVSYDQGGQTPPQTPPLAVQGATSPYW